MHLRVAIGNNHWEVELQEDDHKQNIKKKKKKKKKSTKEKKLYNVILWKDLCIPPVISVADKCNATNCTKT